MPIIVRLKTGMKFDVHPLAIYWQFLKEYFLKSRQIFSTSQMQLENYTSWGVSEQVKLITRMSDFSPYILHNWSAKVLFKAKILTFPHV